MDIEKGTYQAVKDASMDLGGACFLLHDGGKIEVTQIDSDNSKALVKCGRFTDWMHFSRISKCFKLVVDRFYVDERVGCLAVRDRNKDDEWSPGLHQDMDGVMAYWSGQYDGEGGWRILDWQREKAETLCNELNSKQ
jgi:hypothetical protein